jgi:hypothetical protein
MQDRYREQMGDETVRLGNCHGNIAANGTDRHVKNYSKNRQVTPSQAPSFGGPRGNET